MDFLAAVNRALRMETIISGDDDDITTFSDTQHAADISLAQIAIQDELNDLVADRFIGYEEAAGIFTSVTSTTTYALATDFIRFVGKPFLYESSDNFKMPEYPGGKERLRHHIPDYATQTGNPFYWYIEPDTTDKVGLYPTPDSTSAGKIYTYDYEKDVSVTTAAAVLPFTHEIQAQAFVSMAGRRFNFMRKQEPTGNLTQDSTYNSGKSRLVDLMGYKVPPNRYGRKRG